MGRGGSKIKPVARCVSRDRIVGKFHATIEKESCEKLESTIKVSPAPDQLGHVNRTKFDRHRREKNKKLRNEPNFLNDFRSLLGAPVRKILDFGRGSIRQFLEPPLPKRFYDFASWSG
ncbi:MAG TPA: hypothetical protein VMU16_02725 [Candidatus Binataceae bacterium]|nr:hypothetical protein [Candidatus Binataceae bacterium]